MQRVHLPVWPEKLRGGRRRRRRHQTQKNMKYILLFYNVRKEEWKWERILEFICELIVWVQTQMKTWTPQSAMIFKKTEGLHVWSETDIIFIHSNNCAVRMPTPGTKLHYHTLISAAYRSSSSHKQSGNWMSHIDNYNSRELSSPCIHACSFPFSFCTFSLFSANAN